MSNYIRVLNDIKSNTNLIEPTSSQSTCRSLINERLAYPGVVNLFGLNGVGKTVLGWVMAKTEHIVYVVHPSRLHKAPVNKDIIAFVDNARADRIEFRRVLGDLELRGVEKSVVVTHHPADDYVFRVELVLTKLDTEIIITNFKNLGYPSAGVNWNNLWQGLNELVRVIK